MDKIFILQDKTHSYLFYLQADESKSNKLIKVDRISGEILSTESFGNDQLLRKKYEEMKREGRKRV